MRLVESNETHCRTQNYCPTSSGVNKMVVLAVSHKLGHSSFGHLLDCLDVRLSRGRVQVEIRHQLVLFIAQDEATHHSNDQDQGEDDDAGKEREREIEIFQQGLSNQGPSETL